MKNIVSCTLCSVVFFILGYLYSSKLFLLQEFVETNSNSLSRTFFERSSLYALIAQGKNEKSKDFLEALIYSDLIAMDMIDFYATTSSDVFCSQLYKLKDASNETAIFIDELEDRLRKCP